MPTLPLERDPETRAADAFRGQALTAWRFICDREEWDWNDEARRTQVWGTLLEDQFFCASAVTPREWEDLAAKLEEFLANPFAGTPDATPHLEAKPKRKDPAGAVPAAFR